MKSDPDVEPELSGASIQVKQRQIIQNKMVSRISGGVRVNGQEYDNASLLKNQGDQINMNVICFHTRHSSDFNNWDEWMKNSGWKALVCGYPCLIADQLIQS